MCPEQRDCQQEGHNGIFLGNFTSLSEPTWQTERPQLSAHQLGPKSSSAEAAELANNCHGVNPAAKGSTLPPDTGITPHHHVLRSLTSTNSVVSLKADVSKPRFLGELERINPKSMWIMCPSASSKMLPLCLRGRGGTFH